MLLHRCEEKLRIEMEDPTIVYKKCHNPNALVVLRKLDDSKTTESRPFVIDQNYAQFRANELLVMKILTLPDLNEIDCARSLYDSYFEYRVGEIVKATEYDSTLEIISGGGIHFFHSIVAALCFGFVYRDIYDYYDGIWYNYNYNGQLISTHELKKGVMHGKQLEFHEDGTIIQEKFIYNDVIKNTTNRLVLSCYFKDYQLQ